jgi:hypothetical protein
MKFSSTTGPEYHIFDRYYLEMQNSTNEVDANPHYKLVMKQGLFHKTIQRDLSFNGRLDSVKVLENSDGNKIRLRGYTSKVSYVSTDIDSIDLLVPLKTLKQGDVEYRL